MKWSGKTAEPLVEHQAVIASSVYSYVVVNDSGFAPNPFHGFCTLACCKPVIRRTANVGDIVVGLSSGCERIVYAMRIGEVLTFAEYWSDERYACKRPNKQSDDLIEKQGDNIYEPVGPGRFRQLPSRHGPNDVERDINGRNVLVSAEFVYFGGAGPEVTTSLEFLCVRRGHKRTAEPRHVGAVTRWLDRRLAKPRVVGTPALWRREEPDSGTQRPSCG